MQIGFGLVGTGLIAKVHAQAIDSIDGARLVAVCGRSADATAEFANSTNAVAYTDFSEMVAREDIAIVNICTPSGTHRELGLLAAAAGKSVLVEKPIEISTQRADDLIDACETYGVKLGVIFQSRFAPSARRMKEAIDRGDLGRLLLGDAYVKWYRAPEYYAESSWHGTLALDGGGALINQAIHTIDLLRWIMGPMTAVCAMKGALRYPDIEAEDTLVSCLRFQNGALGVIEAATSVAPGFKRRLEISGERGTIILEGDEISVWAVDGADTAEVAGEQLDGGSSNPATIAIEGHRLQIEDMIDAVRNDRQPTVSGRDGRLSLELVEALYRSANENRVIEL